jgi:hypothetical protein
VVDRERDAHGLDGEFGGLLAHGDLVAVHVRQVTHQLAARCACAAAGPTSSSWNPGKGMTSSRFSCCVRSTQKYQSQMAVFKKVRGRSVRASRWCRRPVFGHIGAAR